MDFNGSISQAMAKTMEHLSGFVFVSTAYLTLARSDSYLSHLKSGIKPDTLAALSTAPLQLATLFPDSVIKPAEKLSSSHRKGHYHPYERPKRRSDSKKSDKPRRLSDHAVRARDARASLLTTHPDWPRVSSPINDNYCVNVLKAGLLAGSRQTVKCYQRLPV